MRTNLFLCVSYLVTSFSQAEPNLRSKVVHCPLSQNEPAVIQVGLHGITTLEFPTKIEALDGYGFSVNPAPDGSDLFQISFNKGTNFLSLKAVRPGSEGNLTVVLESKVYSLFCRETNDPSFVVIFDDAPGKGTGLAKEPPAKSPPPTPARLLGFLDKVKGFPTLKVSAPEIYHGLDVAEPNSSSGVEGLDVMVRRVIRDDALDTVGFEVELKNKSDKDYFYDPEGFGVRAGSDVYGQSVSDAGGMVPAGKAETAFFAVTGNAAGNRNDLAVTNRFDVIIRPIREAPGAARKASVEWTEPPDQLPAASREPALPQGDGKNGTPALANNRVDQPKKLSRKGAGRNGGGQKPNESLPQ